MPSGKEVASEIIKLVVAGLDMATIAYSFILTLASGQAEAAPAGLIIAMLSISALNLASLQNLLSGGIVDSAPQNPSLNRLQKCRFAGSLGSIASIILSLVSIPGLSMGYNMVAIAVILMLLLVTSMPGFVYQAAVTVYAVRALTLKI